MSQMVFFDIENRYASLDAKNDPLAKINALVSWETFRSRLEQVWRKPADQRKSNAGCKPWDAIVLRQAQDVQGHRAGRPLQSLRRSGRVSDARPPLLRQAQDKFLCALPGTDPCRQGARRQDGVALPGTTFVLRHAQEAQVSQAGVIEALFNDFDGYLGTQSLPRA